MAVGGHTADANEEENAVAMELDECGCHKHPRPGTWEHFCCAADVIKVPPVSRELSQKIQARLSIVFTTLGLILYIVSVVLDSWMVVDAKDTLKMNKKKFKANTGGGFGLWNACKSEGDCVPFEDAFGASTSGMDGTRACVLMALIFTFGYLVVSIYYSLGVDGSIAMPVQQIRTIGKVALGVIGLAITFGLVGVSIFAGDLEVRENLHHSHAHFGAGFTIAFAATTIIVFQSVIATLVWSST